MRSFINGMMPAAGFFLVATFLLILPGSAFPTETWLSKIQFDKIVHIGMFAVLVWLFCRAFYQKKWSSSRLGGIFMYVAIAAILYGIVMEIVQKDFIPNRSFDMLDIVADTAGALVGYIFSSWLYLKRNA